MSYRLSRLMSTFTAGYGAFSLVQPRHLGDALAADKPELEAYDVLARSYGVRDLAIGALGMFGRSEKTVTAAMLLRVAATLGWATLNTLALAVDRRRVRR